MADFDYAELTHSPERINVISTKLGTGAIKYTDKDKKKVAKLAANGESYVLAAAGDDIEGFIDNIDAGGTSGGFTFGGVARPNGGFRVRARVAAAQATALVIKDLVVAAAQAAVGTESLPLVQKGDGVLNKYRVIRLYGNGTAGTDVLLEKI